MYFTHQQAESTLLAFIKSLEKNLPHWRALVIETSPNAAYSLDDVGIEHLKKTYTTSGVTENVRLFIAADGTVILLFSSVFSSKIRPLAEACKDVYSASLALQNATAAPLNFQEHLYDFSVEAAAFEHFLAKKLPAAPHAAAKPAIAESLSLDAALRQLHSEALQPEARARLLQRSRRDNKKILLVEDDPLSQRLVTTALRSHSAVLSGRYSVHTASSGLDGIKAYIEHAPDMVFLDIDMPLLSGHLALQEMLKVDDKAFVIMLSGNAFKDEIVKAMQSGAKGFVGKPFTPQKLIGYLEKCPTIALGMVAA